MAGRKPGTPKTGGRRRGTANKTTKAAREVFQMAFDKSGGVTALTAWAKLNRTEFYKLFARLIPVELAGSPDAPIVHTIRLVGPDD